MASYRFSTRMFFSCPTTAACRLGGRRTNPFAEKILCSSCQLTLLHLEPTNNVFEWHAALGSIWCPEVYHVDPAFSLLSGGSTQVSVPRTLFLDDLVHERYKHRIRPK